MKPKITLKDFMRDFEQYIATILLIIMTILLILQVASRYIFGYCISWTEEISMICFIMAIYFGTPAAVIKGKHIAVSFFVEHLSFKLAKSFKIFGNVLFFAFCFFILPGFYKLIILLTESNAVMPITRIPKAILYAMIPVCMMFTAYRLVQDTIKVYKKTEDEWYHRTSEFNLQDEIENRNM